MPSSALLIVTYTQLTHPDLSLLSRDHECTCVSSGDPATRREGERGLHDENDAWNSSDRQQESERCVFTC